MPVVTSSKDALPEPPRRLRKLAASGSLDRLTVKQRYDRRDRFALGADVVVDGGAVFDSTTGLRLDLDDLGSAVARMLADGVVALGDIVDAVRATYRMPVADAWARIAAYVDALDQHLMLVRHRPRRLAAAPLRVLASNLMLAPSTALDWMAMARGGRNRRYPPTVAGLTRAVLLTQWIFPAAGLALAAAVLSIGIAALGPEAIKSSDQVQAVILSPVLIGVLHIVLVWTHEAGHLLWARWFGRGEARPLFVVTRGRKVGILRRPGAPRREIGVILAGPLAATAAGVAIAAVLSVAAGQAADGYTLTSVALVLALAHLLSLLPIAADGQNLIAAVKSMRTAR